MRWVLVFLLAGCSSVDFSSPERCGRIYQKEVERIRAGYSGWSKEHALRVELAEAGPLDFALAGVIKHAVEFAFSGRPVSEYVPECERRLRGQG